MNFCGIYQLKNTHSEKVYIGSAASKKGFKQRFAVHKSNLNKNEGRKSPQCRLLNRTNKRN